MKDSKQKTAIASVIYPHAPYPNSDMIPDNPECVKNAKTSLFAISLDGFCLKQS
ncbi:hypothetical protein [Komarekiella delphini-convector]|uniref:hypothetical protein n=1 Tax=Komarekiella delphini-convector TaxID=3050158 RepID=UPI0017858163|nr:hypothetical protein [Komarekiella delphini-convector]